VRLCVDPANLAAVGHDPVDGVRGWGERLAAVHVKDLERWTGRGAPTGPGWSRYGPQPEIRFRALGAGELPWPRILGALLDDGFAGVAYIEHEDALLPRRQSIETAADRLRALLPAARPEGRTW
jgi:sugar phosphate isomerase/epimerase